VKLFLENLYYPMGTGCSFSGGKAAGAWSWPLTPSRAKVKEWVELCLHSTPIRLHSVVLSWKKDRDLNEKLRRVFKRQIMWILCIVAYLTIRDITSSRLKRARHVTSIG